jgi:hypothetical protein
MDVFWWSETDVNHNQRRRHAIVVVLKVGEMNWSLEYRFPFVGVKKDMNSFHVVDMDSISEVLREHDEPQVPDVVCKEDERIS